jgi:ABC-type Zn2+ transport system substrate-binding protein/surface adhesin
MSAAVLIVQVARLDAFDFLSRRGQPDVTDLSSLGSITGEDMGHASDTDHSHAEDDQDHGHGHEHRP